jgi:signal transduction histidine kinase/PAS domain-containing protein
MRAEAALREGAGRLRALADNLPSGMVYQVAMRPDGSGRRFVYLAQSCERLTGVPAEAALADPGALYGAIYPEDRPGLAAAEEAAIRDLAPFEFEARLVRADTGEVRWCRLASAPREVPDGSLVWDGLLVDVTEQRAAEEALREEAHSLEVLNRTGALLAAELDLGRLVQAVTDAATELSGAAFGAFFYNTAGARGEALTLYALSGAPRSAFERFPLPRGTAVFGPTLRGEGVVRSHDITADPRYGRNAPHRGMPEGHLPVRSYLAVPVASRPGEVLGALFFGHPEPGVFAERAERLVAGVAAQAAIAIDNSRLLQAAQREVAARAAAEAELRRLNETLEERVRERTRALEAEAAERERAEEQLRQAQKMEAVGQLTGGIAHDFNNLLTGIVGALAILQRRVDAGRTQGLERYTGAAITSAQRAAALTQRLLAFARSQPLDPKPVDANRLVAGMEDLLRRTLGPAIGLEMVLAGGLWPTLCDPNQLESAILNLAINARDAMPEGGRLTVETANAHLDEAYARAQGGEVEPGQYVAVCVTDTGTGMAPEVAERAFEPFFTTKPLGKGTGLGLSMLYGFVKQSGGHVRVYSEVGRGTTFKLYLARHRGSLETSETGARPGGAPRADAGETVLVVEDEPTVRMLILETLEELGYAAIEAADGPSGLRVLQSDARVDLLVTDVGLPGLDGRQLADAARRAKPGLKVLFITGYAHNAAVGNGVLEPGMEMLTKPFAMDALADKIRSMIDKA